MDRYTLLGNYKAARSTLIIAVVLSVLNCVILYLNLNFSFPYSAILPQLGLVFMQYGTYVNVPPILIVIMFTIIPLALFAISFVLSKSNYKWLTVATALFGIDAVVLIAFWCVVTQFDSGFILNIAFEGIIIFQMAKGVKAGKELNNDFSEAESPADILAQKNVKLYSYNREFAKSNNAYKVGSLLLIILAFFALLLGSTFAAILLEEVSEIASVIAFMAILLGAIVYLCISLIRLMPFINASSYVFYKLDGVVYRMVGTYGGASVPFTNLKMTDETLSAYNCGFVDISGKRKNLVIAKAYPDIEEIIK